MLAKRGAVSAEEDAVVEKEVDGGKESGDDGHDGVVAAAVIEESFDLGVAIDGVVAEVVEPGGVLPRGVDDALLGGASESTSSVAADEFSDGKETLPSGSPPRSRRPPRRRVPPRCDRR